MENQSFHEGEALKKILKLGDKSMVEYAELLDMSSQNMYHHLRKPVLDEDFRRLVKEKLNIDFTDVKQTPSEKDKVPKSSAMSFKGGFLIDFIKRVESGLFPVSNQDIEDMKEMAERWAKEAKEKVKNDGSH